MEQIFAVVITMLLVTGMIYLLVKGYLSDFLAPNQPVRYIVLFITGIFVSGAILHLNSYFGVDEPVFDRIGVLAGFIFVTWLELKRQESNSDNDDARKTVKLSDTLFIIFWVIVIGLLFYAVFFIDLFSGMIDSTLFVNLTKWTT